jgi:hypothetical protein
MVDYKSPVTYSAVAGKPDLLTYNVEDGVVERYRQASTPPNPTQHPPPRETSGSYLHLAPRLRVALTSPRHPQPCLQGVKVVYSTHGKIGVFNFNYFLNVIVQAPP